MPESAIVRADSGKLYRVLQNILDNALRYSLVGTRIYLEAVSYTHLACKTAARAVLLGPLRGVML